MGFMEISCSEPEEVSYGSEEQRGEFTLKETTNTSNHYSVSQRGSTLSLPLCLSLGLTVWNYVKHELSVSANK